MGECVRTACVGEEGEQENRMRNVGSNKRYNFTSVHTLTDRQTAWWRGMMKEDGRTFLRLPHLVCAESAMITEMPLNNSIKMLLS